MLGLFVNLLKLFRRVFFFLLFLLSRIFLSLVHCIHFFFHLWFSFIRPLIVDFLINTRDIFVDYLLMPFLRLLGAILGFLVDKLLKALMYSLEAFCLLFFFLWEICEWKKYRKNFLFGFYLLLLILLWSCYLTFLFTIYDSACQCCLERGTARCGPLFFLLAYTTFFFLELRRGLRRFLEAKVLNK